MDTEPTATVTMTVHGITPATTAELGYLKLQFDMREFLQCAMEHGRKTALNDILPSVFQPMIDALIGELDVALRLAGHDPDQNLI